MLNRKQLIELDLITEEIFTDEDFSEEPNGYEPDIERIKDKEIKCFRKLQIKTRYQHKKIIINDWRFFNFYDQEQLYECLFFGNI